MSITALKIQEDLEKAGVPQAQAKAHTKAIYQVQEGLATKEDLDIATTRLEAKIVATKKDLDAAITNLELKLEANATNLEVKLEANATKLEAKIEATKGELSGQIGALKGDLFKWGAGAMLVLLAAMLAIR